MYNKLNFLFSSSLESFKSAIEKLKKLNPHSLTKNNEQVLQELTLNNLIKVIIVIF